MVLSILVFALPKITSYWTEKTETKSQSLGSCQVTLQSLGSCHVTLQSLGSCQVTLQSLGSCQVTLHSSLTIQLYARQRWMKCYRQLTWPQCKKKWLSFRIKSLSKILEFILFYLLQTAQLKFCHSELNMAVHPLYYLWIKWQCKLHVPIHVCTGVINIIQCRIKKTKKHALQS